jgi:hypothetical protein
MLTRRTPTVAVAEAGAVMRQAKGAGRGATNKATAAAAAADRRGVARTAVTGVFCSTTSTRTMAKRESKAAARTIAPRFGLRRYKQHIHGTLSSVPRTAESATGEATQGSLGGVQKGGVQAGDGRSEAAVRTSVHACDERPGMNDREAHEDQSEERDKQVDEAKHRVEVHGEVRGGDGLPGISDRLLVGTPTAGDSVGNGGERDD